MKRRLLILVIACMVPVVSLLSFGQFWYLCPNAHYDEVPAWYQPAYKFAEHNESYALYLAWFMVDGGIDERYLRWSGSIPAK